MTTTSVMVGMAEIHVAKGVGQFTCLGLGSCIGICALDPVANIAGCAHIMLPESFADKIVDRPGKFANTGVPELLSVMERLGASKSRLVIAIAGGAQVFKFGSDGATSRLDIGARNAKAVIETLSRYGLGVVASDVGGNVGRTISFTLETGNVTVRTAVNAEKQLTNLRK
jgi:chemotaxis protein CheD